MANNNTGAIVIFGLVIIMFLVIVFRKQICAKVPDFPLLCKSLDLGSKSSLSVPEIIQAPASASRPLAQQRLAGAYQDVLTRCPVCSTTGLNNDTCKSCIRQQFPDNQIP